MRDCRDRVNESEKGLFSIVYEYEVSTDASLVDHNNMLFSPRACKKSTQRGGCNGKKDSKKILLTPSAI
jgi:hypothetical protein